MSDDNDLKQAREVVAAVLRYAITQDWKYKSDKESMELVTLIYSSMQADEKDTTLGITVDPQLKYIEVVALLPFQVQAGHVGEIIVAINVINKRLPHGHFDYSYKEKKISFGLQNSYDGNPVTKELISELVATVCGTVVRHAQDLKKLAYGQMTISQFVIKEDTKRLGDPKRAKAEKHYNLLCDFLKEKGFATFKDDDLSVLFWIDQEKSVHIPMRITVDEKRQQIRISEQLPFAKKDGSLATAVCIVNERLPKGYFAYDYKDGRIIFKDTVAYDDREMDHTVFAFLISSAVFATNQYGGDFHALIREDMTKEQFMRKYLQ